jgi:hypothetical protein
MKDRWKSHINVWFPFMYSQKWNCYFQNRIITFFSQFLHSYFCEKFIYFFDRSAYSAAGKYVDQAWEYTNHSQTHECGNWDWGRAIPRKGIYIWDFPCSVEHVFLGFGLCFPSYLPGSFAGLWIFFIGVWVTTLEASFFYQGNINSKA